MSPGLVRYFAFSGKARRAASVSRCAAAISLSVSPALMVIVVIGGRRIAFARAMMSAEERLAACLWNRGRMPG